jgi:hypothetical protein
MKTASDWLSPLLENIDMSCLATFRSRLVSLLGSLALVAGFAAEAAAEPPPYVYALRNRLGGFANEIFGFALDPLTGTLTALPGFPVATGGTGGNIIYWEQLCMLAAGCSRSTMEATRSAFSPSISQQAP